MSLSQIVSTADLRDDLKVKAVYITLITASFENTKISLFIELWPNKGFHCKETHLFYDTIYLTEYKGSLEHKSLYIHQLHLMPYTETHIHSFVTV